MSYVPWGGSETEVTQFFTESWIESEQGNDEFSAAMFIHLENALRELLRHVSLIEQHLQSISS